MAVDLAAAVARGRAVMADVMVDTCTITRDANRDTDRTLQPGSARLAADPDTPTLIYSGACMFVAAGEAEQTVQPGTPIAVATWNLLLPFDAPEVRRGDVVGTITSADPRLAAKNRLWVLAIVEQTVLVTRVVRVSEEPPR